MTVNNVRRPGADVTPGANHGSRTMTIAQPSTESSAADSPSTSTGSPANQTPNYQGTLYLRAEPSPTLDAPPRRQPRVKWDNDVVDNEGLNRKKSKVCCIFRKTRRFDESDSDESDSDCDSDDHHHGHDNKGKSNGLDSNHRSLPPPNEYERMPRYSTK
ncbi:Type 1 phosphatases regulator ypi1 [Dispira parvispora]|uniref:Type 1 phosphatases regulator n=1 Tax=Dispira parvispora TaxID=1520584 RepID=A0A9W8AUB7_9FUNG|nr:Type 1 phosphatases regulator ypi1 [Dispira parvispora]